MATDFDMDNIDEDDIDAILAEAMSQESASTYSTPEEETLEETEEYTEEEVEESPTESENTTDSSEDSDVDEEVETADEVPLEDQEAIEEDIDYKKMYEDTLASTKTHTDFYNQVTGEFTVNGKKVKGFTDPNRVIQSQQMAGGYADKMASFKRYKGHMQTLDSKGLIDDPEKFNFALQLLDGDPEALKKHIKTLEIDPFEMDLENINYKSRDQLPSSTEIALTETLEQAESYGVSETARNTLLKEWDSPSVIQLLSDRAHSEEILTHMGNGVFKAVNERIDENKRSDYSQAFSGQSNLMQYAQSLKELQNEYLQRQQATQPQVQERPQWVLPNNVVEDYSKQVSRNNSEVEELRRQATSVSKRKRTTPKRKGTVNIMDFDDDSMDLYLSHLESRGN